MSARSITLFGCDDIQMATPFVILCQYFFVLPKPYRYGGLQTSRQIAGPAWLRDQPLSRVAIPKATLLFLVYHS
jgi:hypothetical protein